MPFFFFFFFVLKSVFSPAKCDFLVNKLSIFQKKSDIFSDVSVIFTMKRSFFKNSLTMIEKILQFLAIFFSFFLFALESVFSPAKYDFLVNKLSMLQKKSDIFSDVSVIFTLKRSFFKNTLTMIEKILQFLALKRMVSYIYFDYDTEN